ncbi:MAG: autotransporter outer membrane beta-barrel domain-containing protein, partial [Opitutaceae bacterium]|nr:autotransporter outer membrane beta-barrel domain-containing protein [Opitutaceae bacterium]
ASGTINVNGGTLSSRLSAVIGNSGTGVLNITSGGSLVIDPTGYVKTGPEYSNQQGTLIIGSHAGSIGTVNVEGGGSSITLVSSEHYSPWIKGIPGAVGVHFVGYAGNGTLRIADGGSVTAIHTVKDGSMSYTDNGRNIFVVGYGNSQIPWDDGVTGVAGSGLIEIFNGSLTTNGPLYISRGEDAAARDSYGTVIVKGYASNLKLSAGGSYNDIYVGWGHNTHGNLTITDNAEVRLYTGNLFIGSNATTAHGEATISNAAKLTIQPGARNYGTVLGYGGGTASLTLINAGTLETPEVVNENGATSNFTSQGGILRATSKNTQEFLRGFNATVNSKINVLKGIGSLLDEDGHFYDGLTIDTVVFQVGADARFEGDGKLSKNGTGNLILRGEASTDVEVVQVNGGNLILEGGTYNASDSTGTPREIFHVTDFHTGNIVVKSPSVVFHANGVGNRILETSIGGNGTLDLFAAGVEVGPEKEVYAGNNSTLNVVIRDGASFAGQVLVETPGLLGGDPDSALANDYSTNDPDGIINIDIKNGGTFYVTPENANFRLNGGDSVGNITCIANNGLIDFTRYVGSKVATLNPALPGTEVIAPNILVTKNYSGTGGLVMRVDYSAFQGDTDGIYIVSDRLHINGDATGGGIVTFVPTAQENILKGNSSVEIIRTTSKAIADTLTFTGSVWDSTTLTELASLQQGTGANSLDDQSSSFYLKRGSGTQIGPGGQAVADAAAAQSMHFLTQMDNLYKRMGELRLLRDVRPPQSASTSTGLTSAISDAFLSNLWAKGYAQRLDAKAKVLDTPNADDFEETLYGLDVGADIAWYADGNDLLYAGFFLGFSKTDRTVDTRRIIGSIEGTSKGISAGGYLTWLRRDGWYAEGILKLQYFDNDFDVALMQGVNSWARVDGGYHNLAIGISGEFGKQIPLNDKKLYIEPAIQASGVFFTSASYDITSTYGTPSSTRVSLGSAEVLLGRIGATLSKVYEQKENKGFLQPYVRLALTDQVSSGGKVSWQGSGSLISIRPNYDGFRVDVSAGIIWQIRQNNQLHLEYEASFSDKFTRPWSLFGGLRHQF